MRARPLLVICTSLAVAAVQVVAAVPAGAGDDSGRRRVQVLSGPSPFADGCPGRRLDEWAITGSEIEPAITVDPSDRRRLVATWQQDIGTPAARSDLIAGSEDGGRTWRAATIPGLTVCTGGTADFASDPWLSTGGDGTVYFSGTNGTSTADPPPVAVVASRSRDGGRTWAEPTTVAPAEPGNDTDSVSASPTEDGHAYLVWANWDHAMRVPMTNALRFARTTDSGDTWSAPVTVHHPGPTAIDFSGHVLVLPSGDLLAVWVNADIASGLGTLFAARSADEGGTWEPAVVIAVQPVGSFTDPETAVELPQPGFTAPAIAPDGTVYVASESSSSPTAGAVDVSTSRDGGRTWTSAPLPGVSAFAFEPAIAVDSRGTVGLLWYDIRDDRPGDGELTTDVWFARSRDRGATWRQEHLAGPFDLRTAPNGRLGEYQGLVGLRRGFAGVVTLAGPSAQNGPSDVLVARVGTGRR
jgi:BNR repeat protein